MSVVIIPVWRRDLSAAETGRSAAFSPARRKWLSLKIRFWARRSVQSMKLKCRDGKARKFRVSLPEFYPTAYPGVVVQSGQMLEAYCVECGETFGVHDTTTLKPEFINHICHTSAKATKGK